MSAKGKEKEVATGGKRRRGDASDDDKARKRKNREVLQFFEDAADVDDDESDYSDFDDEEYEIELKVKKEPRTPNLPFIPKEEQMDEEEFDKMMEERYRTRSGFARYSEDNYDEKSGEGASGLPSSKDPKIWKVKCMVGREKHSAFCLMQKFVDLKSLGTKLQIISAFAFDHVKGFVYIEADKQCDIVEACKGLCGIYSTRASVVQGKEVQYLFTVRRKANVIREGMWARVKNGKYKGDIAQVVSVNDARKKATVKLIPRIDLQMMAKKIGGGISIKNAATPAPRLINSSELEEFRPLIQYRRDRDTGLMVEVLDGLMFKDGFLYKKVSVESLNFSGVTPSEDELVKFQPSENNDVDNSEWLSQLYGSPKKKRMGNDKGGEKGESSSGSGVPNGFELYDLVCVGRKDFGLIVGMEKDDHFKILKHGPEAQIVSTSARRDVKSGPSDMKFSAFDCHSKTVSVNDTIKVLEGPLKDRQGIVKHIYRGIIFAHDDQNETENGGYFCCKSQICEKINMSDDACKEKGGESGFFGFEDSPSSPKSPLSPKIPWQTFESNRDSNQGDKEGTFSIGQTLRIRIGPLKGYLCRVLAVRYSEATVKLDSQHKVLTVKFEHLAEVHGRKAAVPSSEDPGSSSFKPFDMLGTEGGTGWANGAGTSADGSGWNTGGNTESTPWPSFSASGFKQPDSSGTKEEDSAWGRTENSTQNASWGATATNENTAGNNESNDSWSKAATKVGSSSSDGWGKPQLDSGTNENTAGNNDSNDNWSKAATKVGSSSSDGWGKPKLDSGSSHGAAEAWGKGKPESENPSGSWAAAGEMKSGSWDKSTNAGEDNWTKASAWNQQKSESKVDAWGSKEAQNEGGAQGDSWGKDIEKDSSSGGNVGWNSSDSAAKKPVESSWGNAGSGWAQPEAQNNASDSGWTKAKVDGTSQAGLGKQDESAWGKQEGGKSAWNEQDGGFKKESSWGKQDGGSSWNQKDGGSVSSGWGNKNSGSAPNASGWNQKTVENDGKDGDGWNSGKASDGGSTKGWGQGSSWGTGSNDTGKNDESSWGKKSSWNSGAGDSGGNTSSAWGKSVGWGSGTGEEKQESYGWGKKSSWNQDDSVSGGDDQGSGGWRGGYGGRGRSERGGYRGRGERGEGFRGRGDRGEGFRGRGDRGEGFRGRGDRGGYRGRGRSDRGGYGGRGRRDEGGDSGGGGWSGGGGGGWSGGGGGWSGGGGGGRGSWSQGGDDKSQGKSWSSSWNQGGDGESGGGWNKGDGEAEKGGWKSADGSGGSGWNQSGEGASGGGWNGGGSSSSKGGGGGGWDSAGGLGWN